MADSVKNVTFRFKADTSQIMRIIDDLNKAIAKTQSSLSTFKIAGDAKQIKQQLASINKKLEIQADTRQARRELNELNKEIVRIQKQPAGGGTGFLDTLKGGLAAFGIVATADALVDLGKSTIQAAVDFEKLTASFRALIGDKERADQAIRDIQQFALETPFDVTNIAAAGKTLLGYGINVKDLLPTLRQLGDVSAASGGDIQRVALAFGQVAAKGKLQGEEIRQLVNVGFNPLQEISKATGESMAALAKRVEEGRVTFDEVAEAFRVATEEGGRFYNLASTLNNTFGGQLQKLTEQINLFKIEVGTAAAEELRPLIQELVRFFTAATNVAKTIRENVVVLGIFKGVLAFVVSLLFKSANAYVANALSVKTWNSLILIGQKQIIAFSLALRINTVAIGANTTSQKAAAVATTLWDAASKGLVLTTSILGTAVKSLWATIAANPIGALIAGYYILNGLLDLNTEKTKEAILQEKNLLDIKKLNIDYADQEAGAIKATEGSLRDQQKQIVEAIRSDGLRAEYTQGLIEKLEKQEQIDLKSIKTAGDKTRALRELNDVIEKLIQKKSIEIEIRGAENKLNDLRENLGKATNQFDTLIEERKIEPDFIQKLLNFINPSYIFPGDVALARDKKRLTERENFYINYIYEIKNNIAKAEKELADAQAKLIGFRVGAPGADKKDPFKEQKDALADLRKFIQGLISDIDKLNTKKISLQIEQMPEDTEEQQRQKEQALFDETTRINKKEAAEERRKATELYEIAVKEGADKKKAKEEYGKALDEIQNKYNVNEEINTINHQKRLFDIVKFWNDRNKQNLEDTRKEETEEYLRQLQRREEGLQGIQSDIEERFVKAPPGGAKELRQRFKDITAALQDNLQEQLQIRKANRVLEFVGEKEDARKRYELLIGNIKETGEERTKQEARYWQQYLDEINLRQTKFDNDITEMEQETADKQFEIGKNNSERLKQLERERKLLIIDGIQQTIDAAIQTAQTIIAIEQQKNDQLIQLQQERVDKAREIADKGNAALLEAEEKRLTELQKKRAKFVRQQQGLILAQTIAESTLAIARAAAEGGGWASAITIAATLAALAAGIAQARAQSTEAIGGFAEGGWTGKGGKYEPAGIVHREEFVVKKGPAEKFRPMLEQMNRGRDPLLAAGMGQQVIMINNVGVEERLARIEKAIAGQDRMQLTIDESGIHGLVSHYQWKNQRIRNKTR